MNAERLHLIAKGIDSEFASLRVLELFQELMQHLQNSINQPQQPQWAANLASKRTEIVKVLRSAPSNRWGPAWRQVVYDIGGRGLVGVELAERIERIFNRNQITLATAQSELQTIHQAVTTFRTGLTQLIQGFANLKIGFEDLQPGEAEVGILIPRKQVANDLTEFADELKEFKFIFETFQELTTGKVGRLPLRTISSSELLVYVGTLPVVGQAIARAVERIIDAYKKLLEIRKARSEMEKGGVPPEALKGVDDHVEKQINNAIDEATVEIVKDFSEVDDAGRKNEIHTKVKISLKMVANRVDRGYGFDARAKAAKDAAKEDRMVKAVEAINAILPSLQYVHLEGKPILSLPPSHKELEDESEPEKKIKKK